MNNAYHPLAPFPIQSIELPFSLHPDHAPIYARQFQQSVLYFEKVELTFSLSDLYFLDRFLSYYSNEGIAIHDFADVVFRAGCYAGQLLVIHRNGQWIAEQEVNLPRNDYQAPVQVKFGNKNACDPIGRAFRKFQFGIAEDLVGLVLASVEIN